MPTLLISLADVLTDREQPIDFTALPADEVVAHIRNIYGFLGSMLDVTVEDGVATITLSEENTFRVNEALRTMQKAQRAAERGNYDAAIRGFQEIVNVPPLHTVARRRLAMAQMEVGNASAARTELVRVLRLNPEDSWAYLILGNIALRRFLWMQEPGGARRRRKEPEQEVLNEITRRKRV